MTFARRLLFPFLSCAVVLAAVPAVSAAKSHARPAPAREAAPAYKGAIIVDAASGKVLFEDNADISNPPASVTKLMTYLVVSDHLQKGTLTLQTPITVTAEDARMGGTQVWLKEKEVFTVEDLLYALMIQSANDAASALARTTAGTTSAFVELMNARAQSLGMLHTTFRSPHGLPPPSRRIADGDLTTPRDLATLARYLVLHTDILKYTSVKTRRFGEGQRPSDTVVVMNNHNHLLGRINGVDGLKTGFTNGAGFCLAATALRNGHRIIAVSMGSTDRKTRDIKMAELLERGFRLLPADAPAFARAPDAPPATTPITAAPLPAGHDVLGDSSAPVIKFSIPDRK